MEPTSKQLLEALLEAHRANTDTIPKGFKTRAEWQREWNCSSAHAKNLLNAGLDKGLIEVRKYRVARKNGACIVPHYGPTSLGKKAGAK